MGGEQNDDGEDLDPGMDDPYEGGVPRLSRQVLSDFATGAVRGIREGDLGAVVGKLPVPDQLKLLRFLAMRETGVSIDVMAERLASVEYLLKMAELLGRFASEVSTKLRGPIGKLSRMVKKNYNVDLIQRRKHAMVNFGRGVELHDDVLSVIARFLKMIEALLDACRVFSQEMRENVEGKGADFAVAASHDLSVLNYLESTVEGFMEMAVSMRGEVDRFPDVVTKIVKSIADYVMYLEKQYGVGVEQGRNPVLEMIGLSEDTSREVVPFFDNNGRLTDFLHRLFLRIPDLEETKEGQDEFDDASYDRVLFAQLLLPLADRSLLENLHKQMPFRGAADLVGATHVVLDVFVQAYDDLQLTETRSRLDPADLKRRFKGMVDKALHDDPLINDRGDFSSFDLEGSRAYLSGVDFSRVPAVLKLDRKALSANGDGLSERSKALRDIYRTMWDKLLDLAKNGVSDGSEFYREHEKIIGGFVGNLIVEKAKIGGDPRKKLERRLGADQLGDNFSYSADTPGIGGPKLERVPTPGVGYDTIFGADWRRLIDDVAMLLQYGSFANVFGPGSPRGKARFSRLIISPPGAGKNHFIRALSSDPRLVVVHTTTDRIMNPYVGEAERNPRILFEKTEVLRYEHDRAAVIGWDEFDSLFPERGGHGGLSEEIARKMQKSLQSIMDGDHVFDGVFLWALTNEPDRIPPEVIRRFAHLDVIRTLTSEERQGMLKYLLGSLPVADGFDDQVNWGRIGSMTEGASGDMLGKIFDKVFEGFIACYQEVDRNRLLAINDEFGALVKAGRRVTPSVRRDIYAAENPGICVSAGDFEVAVQEVMSNKETVEGIRAQADFYSDVDSIIAAAFRGRRKVGFRE